MPEKNIYCWRFGLFVMLLLYLSETCAMKTSRLRFHVTDRNRCLSSASVIHRVLRVSIGACVEECFARNGKCMAVNYRKKLNLCELLDAHSGEMIENNSKSGACEFVAMTDIYMNTLSERCLCNTASGESCNLQTLTCSMTECPVFSLNNGVIKGNMYDVGSVLKYNCNPNYAEVNNITSSTCLESGQWSYQPECIVDCGPPSDVTNANVLPGSTLLDNIRTYQCNSGFQPDPNGGTMDIACTVTGEWSAIRFTCLIDCGTPTVVSNTTVSSGSTLQYDVRTYECNTGFAPDPNGGTMDVTCKSSGEWSDILFTCIVDCGTPPVESNAQVSEGSTLLGDSRTYECTTGFAPDPHGGVTMVTTCNHNGHWSSTHFTCIVDCGVPPAESNAQLIGGSTLLGDSRRYQCSSGFAPDPTGGSMETTCQNNGDWSSTSFTCIVDCGLPPAVSNAYVLGGTTLLGDSRTYQCSSGFAPDPTGGTMETMCGSNRDWSSTSFTCIVDCGLPPAVSNAYVLGGLTLLGNSRTYQCKSGLAPDPTGVTMETTCQNNGDWSSTSFTCIVDCGTPTTIQNAVIRAGTTTVGSVRTFDCGIGYLSNGMTPTITCMSSGYWSYTSLVCQATTIGNYCDSDSGCIGTGAVCISFVCFCGPLYRYDTDTHDCVQVCTSVTDQFVSFLGKNINGFNEFGNIDYITESACLDACRANSECGSVDYFSGPGARCYVSKVTYYMVLDAYSFTIVDNNSTVFSRTCIGISSP